MTSKNLSPNAYTDAPQLHSHWLPGSLQLLIWLLFHPSAWRSHLAQFNATLAPDFALVDLKPDQWRNFHLKRILVLAFGVWPLLIGLTVGLVFLITGSPSRLFWEAVLSSLIYTAVAGIAVGLMVSLAAGLVYGIVMGLLVGIALPLGGGAVHGLIYAGAASVASSVLFSFSSRRLDYSLSGYPKLPSFVRILSAGINPQVLKKLAAGLALGVVTTALVIATIYDVVSGTLLQNPGVAPANEPVAIEIAILLGLIGGPMYGLVYGLMIWGRSRNWRYAAGLGLLIGVSGGLSYGLIEGVGPDGNVVLYNLGAGVAGGLLFAGLYALPYLLVRYLAGTWTAATVSTFIAAVSWLPIAPYIFPADLPPWPQLLRLSLGVALLGLTLAWWRPILLYPFTLLANQLLYRRDERRPVAGTSLLRFHSAFWDEQQWLPLFGLDAHLSLVAARAPGEGQTALNYLATSRQRWAAQATQLELLIDRLEQCNDIGAIKNAHYALTSGRLEDPRHSLLSKFSTYSRDVKAALNHASAYHKRRALYEVGNRLNSFIRELNLTDTPYAKRFHPIAVQWYHVVVNHLETLVRAVEPGQEIDNPYIFSSPLTEEQGVFVGRKDIVNRIAQLLGDPRRPPLLLYGQRRMGKTSLLRNLGRLLPSSIVPFFVDGQGAALATSYGEFLYSMARQMAKSAAGQRGLTLSALSRKELAESPFMVFNDWLDEVETILEAQDKTMALLALDEVEALARVTAKERFDAEDLLNLFRNLMQHRPRFKVLLAGSHTLEEFQRWASYLINMQMLKIGYLEPAEALQLVEQPIPNFALTYDPEASQQVLKLTHGHPHLIQLLCHEIVLLKNRQSLPDRRLVSFADVEAAVQSALDVGNLFFADIQQNQVDNNGLELLCLLAIQGTDTLVPRDYLASHFGDALDSTLNQLRQRDLIEREAGGYRFQVEMIRRWFAQSRE